MAAIPVDTNALISIMSPIGIFVITTLCSLGGLYLNTRMLLIYVSADKVRNAVLQQRRPLVVCQFVAQVTMLVVNSVEASNELDVISIQHRESCFAFYKVISTFATFFSCGNLLVMVAIESGHSMGHQYGESLSKQLLSAAFTLAVIGSGIICWSSCFNQEIATLIPTTALFILVSAIAVLVFVAWRTQPDHTNLKNYSPKPCSLFDCFKAKCEFVLFVVLFLVGVGVMTVLISRSSLCESDQARANEKIHYLIIMNFTAGIAMPLAVTDLTDSSYEDENEEMKVFII